SLRHCSVGRREGPSMAQRGYLGIHAEVPTAQCLRSASVVNGAFRSKAKQSQSGACPVSMWLHHRYREQARSHRKNTVPPRTRSAIRPPRGGG
ncbi:hypothetical protein B0E42_00025, partial [Pseudomonas sp. A25(2017)]